MLVLQPCEGEKETKSLGARELHPKQRGKRGR